MERHDSRVGGYSEMDGGFEIDRQGQVGIGTLIVFLAMVLVAMVGAGVLLETAGSLQGDAQATGQQSSDQVTNQLRVGGVVGTASGEGIRTETIGFDAGLNIDDGDTVEVSVSFGDGEFTFYSKATGARLPVSSGDTLRFDTVGETSIRITNVETTDSLRVVDTDDLSIVPVEDGDDDSITFDYTFTDAVAGEVTSTGNLFEPALGNRVTVQTSPTSYTDRYVHFDGPTTGFGIGDGQTVTAKVYDGPGTLENGDGDTLGLTDGDTLQVEIAADSQSFTVVNEASGDTLTVDADGRLGVAGLVELQYRDGLSARVDDGVFTRYSRYVFTRNAGSATVSELHLDVASGPGSAPIDMSQTTVTLIGPDGVTEFTYADFLLQNDRVTVAPVQDEDDSLPVLRDGDRFTLAVDAGTFEEGAALTILLTPPAGETTQVTATVPVGLSRDKAVVL